MDDEVELEELPEDELVDDEDEEVDELVSAFFSAFLSDESDFSDDDELLELELEPERLSVL